MDGIRFWASLALAGVASCTGARTEAGTDAGTDTASCSAGTTTFVMHAAGDAGYCIGAPGSCSTEWLTIVGPSGGALVLDASCVADCALCQPVGCPALCAAPTRLPAGGVQLAWDGTMFATGSCGAGPDPPCASRACAPPGRYTARMCAYRDAAGDAGAPFCSPVPSGTCVEIAFDWPPADGAATVEGTIVDASGGG